MPRIRLNETVVVVEKLPMFETLLRHPQKLRKYAFVSIALSVAFFVLLAAPSGVSSKVPALIIVPLALSITTTAVAIPFLITDLIFR